MSSKSAAAPQVIGQLALKLAELPEKDLQLVITLVDHLGEKGSVEPLSSLSVEEMREEARRRAHLLRDVPREQLVARFIEVGEQIRQEAISKGTAIEGDWTGD